MMGWGWACWAGLLGWADREQGRLGTVWGWLIDDPIHSLSRRRGGGCGQAGT